MSLGLREVTRGLVPVGEVAKLPECKLTLVANKTNPCFLEVVCDIAALLTPNNLIFSALIWNSGSMDAAYTIDSDSHEIGFWDTPGTPTPPDIPTPEEGESDENIDMWAC